MSRTVPSIIDYPTVLAHMSSAGFHCNYYNSGAFGFPPDTPTLIRGWIGPADSTIKPQFLPLVKNFPAPYAANLTAAAVRFWISQPAPKLWLMPKSHWHFELHDGSRDWLPKILHDIGINPTDLENRADGSALEFPVDQAHELAHILQALLQQLKVSDFSLAFPGLPIVCTIHQHTQLWWTTTDEKLIQSLDAQLITQLTAPAQ